LDTNIFVYSFDKRTGSKMRQAQQLIREGMAARKAVISYQVVQEFFSVAFRRFEQPMSTPEAEQYLSTVFRPLLAVHSSETLIGQALRLHGRHRLAWYDALIVAAALESECSILYSEDLQSQQRFGDLRISNPFL
jgi:predicted nucleic acid-binding protein